MCSSMEYFIKRGRGADIEEIRHSRSRVAGSHLGIFTCSLSWFSCHSSSPGKLSLVHTSIRLGTERIFVQNCGAPESRAVIALWLRCAHWIIQLWLSVVIRYSSHTDIINPHVFPRPRRSDSWSCLVDFEFEFYTLDSFMRIICQLSSSIYLDHSCRSETQHFTPIDCRLF